MSLNKEMLSLTNMMSNLLVRDPTIIQKVFRGYLARKNINTISSKYQSKEWRQRYISGNQKDSSSEKYQRRFVEKITGNTCPKCIDRINHENYEIIPIANPMTKNKTPVPNGFEYTEDFDGKQIYTDRDLYYNFKMCIGSGGGQTRTLREVAHFIEYQLKYNLKHKYNIKYFVNILDGDICYKHYKKYFYILNKEKYKHVKKFVYIGDTYGFIDWFDSINVQ